MPIYKGGTLSEMSNYCPISRLPVISKVIEKAVFNPLSQYPKKFNLLSEDQYVFRAVKPTSDAMMDHSHFL